MKKIQSVLCAAVLALSLSSTVFAGNIHGVTATASGNIHGITATASGNIHGITAIVYESILGLLTGMVM